MIEPGKIFAPFGANLPVRAVMTGTGHGDCNPLHEGAIFRIKRVADILGASTVFAPRVAFTNRVLPFTFEASDHIEKLEYCFYRTKDKADGGVVIKPSQAITVCNADCPIGLLYHPQTNRLALIHLGLRCFWRPDGSDSILKIAIDWFDCPPFELHFWVGAGAGPCCFGYQQVDPKLKIEFADCIYGRRGSRQVSGHHSLDLELMILQQVSILGLREYGDDTTDGCTSCHNTGYAGESVIVNQLDFHNQYGDFYSNLRDEASHLDGKKHGERNCFMAMLV